VRCASERGAATVLAVALSGLLLLLGSVLAVMAALVADHRRAQASADLAALGAATAHARGQDACAAAARVAQANGGILRSCAVIGADVEVAVSVSGPRWRTFVADLEGRARAGPG
jgi:secretion/DNA translocation related TadE-like protein